MATHESTDTSPSLASRLIAIAAELEASAEQLVNPSDITDDDEQPDLHDAIGRTWNDAMQLFYAIRELSRLLDDNQTLGYVIEREAERGVEHMNQLERLLWEARK